MKDSFTIEEIKEFFESHVKNSDRHGNSYYVTLDGETHSTDVGYFIEGMEYFLKDLQYHLDEINKPEMEKIKAINSYGSIRECLNNLHKHYKGSVHGLTLVKSYLDNPVSNYYTFSIYNIDDHLGDKIYQFIESSDDGWFESKTFTIYFNEEYSIIIVII